MGTRDCRRRTRAAFAGCVTPWPVLLAACSVANLSYREVERDLDALVRVEGAGPDEKLVYETDVALAPWYARSYVLLPLKPLLMLGLPATTRNKLENPSEKVRELLVELAPKAGDDLGRAVASTRLLVRVAALDESALNRIAALDGLGCLAVAHGVDLVAGLTQGTRALDAAADLGKWRADFQDLRPAARTPPGSALAAADAERYRAALAGLGATPRSHWQDRLAVVNSLDVARRDEGDADLRAATTAALQQALGFAIQWSVVDAMAGRESALVDVRMRAIEIIHRAGGPDSVPLLLAWLVSSPAAKATGEPDFDSDVMLQRRLIHYCGQLDRARALQRVQLPGREPWQAVAPVEFLAQIILNDDPFTSPTVLPAREALARCLGRSKVGLADDLGPGSVDWVTEWYAEYTRTQGAPR